MLRKLKNRFQNYSLSMEEKITGNLRHKAISIVNNSNKNNSEEPERLWKTLAISTSFDLGGQARQDAQSEPFCASVCALAYFREETSSGFMARVVPTTTPDPSTEAFFGIEKRRKDSAKPAPPRLVGANEGGTDRPVCALPLSGSCRASTPKCTLHRSQRRLSFSLRVFASLFHHPSYLVLRNFVEREAGTLCLPDGEKKGTGRVQVRIECFFFLLLLLLISSARNI